MKTLGYDKPLYILPFDHRGSFQTKLFGWTGALTPEQTAQISSSKQVIYDGFQAALRAGVPERKAGILVDEQFGSAILQSAKDNGYTTACPAEKSGQDEFDFEYGEDFAQHIETVQPTFCKVLVRYNPEGDGALNVRQSARLRRLSEYLHDKSKSLFMFELLVPPEKAELERLDGDKKAYDVELRPKLMVQAIEELQTQELSRTSGKSRGSITTRIARKSRAPLVRVVAIRSGASSWGVTKAIKKFMSGLRLLRKCRDLLASRWAVQVFGTRL